MQSQFTIVLVQMLLINLRSKNSLVVTPLQFTDSHMVSKALAQLLHIFCFECSISQRGIDRFYLYVPENALLLCIAS